MSELQDKLKDISEVQESIQVPRGDGVKRSLGSPPTPPLTKKLKGEERSASATDSLYEKASDLGQQKPNSDQETWSLVTDEDEVGIAPVSDDQDGYNLTESKNKVKQLHFLPPSSPTGLPSSLPVLSVASNLDTASSYPQEELVEAVPEKGNDLVDDFHDLDNSAVVVSPSMIMIGSDVQNELELCDESGNEAPTGSDSGEDQEQSDAGEELNDESGNEASNVSGSDDEQEQSDAGEELNEESSNEAPTDSGEEQAESDAVEELSDESCHEASTVSANSDSNEEQEQSDTDEDTDIVEAAPGRLDWSDTENCRMLESATDLHARVELSQEQTVQAEDFEILRLIGIGAYGRVFVVRKASGVDAGRVYAMKVISKVVAIHGLQTAEYIKTERQILEAVEQTPFVVHLYYAFQNEQNLYLVMNFVQGGELFRLLQTFGAVPEWGAMLYIGEVALALVQLHKRNILYRDLKLENVLIDAEGHIVLADLGLSTVLTEENGYRAHDFCGTLEYMAPEVLMMSPEGYGKPVDWWSLGVLTVELLTGVSPFAGPNLPGEQLKTETERRILHGEPLIPSSFSQQAGDLVRKLLEKDPKRRLDACGIRDHPFFEAIEWSKLLERRYRMPFRPSLDAADDVRHFDAEFTSQPNEVPECEAPPGDLQIYRGFNYAAPQILELVRHHEDEGTEYRNAEVENLSPIPKHLVLGRRLYSGGCGTCFLLEDDLLVKVVHLSSYRASEVDTLMSSSHRNIVKHYHSFRTRTEIWIIMEYLTGKDLAWCTRNWQPNEQVSRLIFRQLVMAVRHLHRQHFIHGDLKPENVVCECEETIVAKLVDFGHASYNREFLQWRDRARYTLDYAPPELLLTMDDGHATYSPAVDIYGLGATLYHMIVGHAPFRQDLDDVKDSPVAKEQLRERIKRNSYNQHAEKWLSASQAFRDLVQWCLQKDPEARPQLMDILSSEWLTGSSNEEAKKGAGKAAQRQEGATSSSKLIGRRNSV